MADLAISPSPARDAVVVSYSLARAGVVSLQLYDITGARVATIASGRQSAGAHSVLFRNQNSAFRIARGVYLLKFQTETRRAVRKLLLN